MATTATAFTVMSTTFACALAIGVEGAAHRTLYRFFPDWYQDVPYAYGLDLESSRLRAQPVATSPAESSDVIHASMMDDGQWTRT